jgi:hypothetical protein
MQKLLLAFIFLGLNASLSAQLPTIHSHTIIPANLTSSSQIKIVTHLETPNAAFTVDKQFTVTPLSQNIKLHLCYAHGMATVISHHLDTFIVGQLPPGVYSVQLNAYMSSAGQHCARIDSNFASFTFTVSGIVGLGENTMQNKMKFFPNPAKDYMTIESGTGSKHVRIFSLQGQLIRIAETSSSGMLSLQGLSVGMYLLEVVSSEGKEVHRIVIQ